MPILPVPRIAYFALLSLSLWLLSALAVAQAPQNFSQAKYLLKKNVYFDQNENGFIGSSYCGCDWQWVGRSGGRTDLASCGYEIRAQEVRANRTEYEHVVAAYAMGSQRQCWQNGGRKNCVATDEQFSVMEANMHNLTVVIGEVNADRSNYRFGMVSGNSAMYGQCNSKTDFKQRVFEPRDEVKGMVARINFYMHDRYNLRMSEQQQRLFMAWHKQFPVSEWERIRDKRIANVMGHSNPFVTGEKQWSLGFKPSGEGLTAQQQAAKQAIPNKASTNTGVYIGNKNSKIFHPPSGCNSANRLPAEKNHVYFSSREDALAQGYRLSGHCQ